MVRKHNRCLSRPHFKARMGVSRRQSRRRWKEIGRAEYRPRLPNKWIDYSGLKVIPGDALGNMQRAEMFNRALNLAKLKQPADPNEWRIDPQIVGAVILFTPNTETFSAGILQPPYFDPNGDAASNYGSAGAGIAHEISHSFDELGESR